MTETSIASVILAAGKGKRMKSKHAKVLHAIAGRPMLSYSVETAGRLPSDKILVVVGHQAEAVKQVLAGTPVQTIDQGKPLGTGHAVLQTQTALADFDGAVLILNGDVPLITVETLRSLIRIHHERKADLTLLTTILDRPDGYGRIVRDASGSVTAIVEEGDAPPAQRAIREVNTAFYVVNRPFLFEALKALKTDNIQKEYYLTDIVRYAVDQGSRLEAVGADSPDEVMGVNSRLDLSRIEKVVYRRIAERHLLSGVSIPDPETVWIDFDVKIGQDTVVYPNVRLEKGSRIGEDCTIGSYAKITASTLENGVTIKEASILTESKLEENTVVGPFAHLRPGTILRKGAVIGNFVETKKTEIGEGSKAKHLTYLGDAIIGKEVNIGAGTIICNYDGVQKHQTIIEDHVFVGSDTQLIAPVRIGRGATIGAGSTVTRDVSPDSLAISRTKQIQKAGWSKKRRADKTKKGGKGA